MPRTLTKNHEHFQRAVKRMPLGVASNFRFWGEDRTIYQLEDGTSQPVARSLASHDGNLERSAFGAVRITSDPSRPP